MLKKLLGKLKNDKGFTLMEAILSIAILSVLSVFILQMFIVSERANTKAQNMDIAAADAMTTIENFKAVKKVDDFIETIKNDLMFISKDSDNYKIVRNYDKNWNEMKCEGDNYGNKVSFVATLFINKEESSKGSLYSIKVEVLSVNEIRNVFSDSDDTNLVKSSELVVYETNKYFPVG